MNDKNYNPSVERAISALSERGVGCATELGTATFPGTVLAWCEWWDKQQGVTAGLLVKRIRSGETPPQTPRSKREVLFQKFVDYARRHPVGSSALSHSTLQSQQRHPDTECIGDLVVEAAAYPVITLRCDVCGYEAGLTAGAIQREKAS